MEISAMDFEAASQRLARDQQKIRGRKPLVVSEKAKKQAEFQRKQRAKVKEEREKKRQLEDYQKEYIRQCERSLHVKGLGGGSSESLLLEPTSIYGTGDKISLPPSVLETLTAELGDSFGNPWIFRIGILNDEYLFPASPLVQTLKPPVESEETLDAMSDSDDDGDDKRPYLDEMSHKYVSYTHCTVVEFTQEEGFVGIPVHIAASLLDPKNRLPAFASKNIPTTRTVDPAKASATVDDGAESSAMDEEPSTATPGHVAYGAFDVPNVPLEISLVKLPKGTGCTLVPTKEAIRNGFYALKDIKLVLEQSLIRTRATLSKGDVVSTWHRGRQYDLDVTLVLPATFGAVTCINTDIEVDIGEAEANEDATKELASPNKQNEQSLHPSQGRALGTGHALGSTDLSSRQKGQDHRQGQSSVVVLRPEPPSDQTENVVSVQVRYSGGNGKRRFDVSKATVNDIFEFTQTLISSQAASNFRLVTRFPRRVLTIESRESLLSDVGIQAGQELFLVETQ